MFAARDFLSAKIWCLAMFLAALSISGCQTSAVQPVKSAWATEINDKMSVREWGRALIEAYREDGLVGLGQARQAMRCSWDKLDRDGDDDFADASFILDVGENWMTEKECDIAKRTRALARRIEAKPGHAQGEWQEMYGVLSLFWFGMQPTRFDSEDARLPILMIYAEIAGVRPTDLFL